MSLPDRAEFFRRTLACVTQQRCQVEGDEYRLDASRYHDANWFAREQQQVFARYPMLVAHEAELAAVGDCLAVDLPGRPLVMTRAEDGELRAFYNVCRHRGSRLLGEAGVCRRRSLVCPYHAWTYRLDGALKSVPQRQLGFPSLDLNERGLVELPLSICHGLVFVAGRNAAHLDINKHLGDIVSHWDEWRLGEYHLLRRQAYDVAANWKAIYDAFCEGYHVQRLHRATLSEFFLDNLAYTEACGEHMVTSIARQGIDLAQAEDPQTWRLAEQATFVYHLFPNVIVVFSPDYVNVITLQPIDAGHTRADVMMMIPEPPADAAAEAHWQRSYQLIVEQVFVREDFAIAESAQPGLGSGANKDFLLGRFEWPIRHFHQCLDVALAGSSGDATGATESGVEASR